MTDDRPRYGERLPAPQYGEFATPQDQERAAAAAAARTPPALAGSPASASPLPPASSLPPASPTPLWPARRKPRRWDLVVTSVLLGYAAVNVLAQLFSGSTLETVMTEFYRAQSIGTYTPTALAQNLGTVLNVVTIVLFIVTVFATWWMMRRGRIAFWVPLVGGAVATIVAVVFVAVLLQGDPAFISYMDGLSS